MEAIRFKSEILEEDAVRFNLYNTFNRNNMSKILMVISPLIGISGVYIEFVADEFSYARLFVFILAIVFPLLMALMIKYQAKKIYKNQNLQGIKAKFEFTEKSVRNITSKGDATFEYKQLVDIRENKKYLYIYISKLNAFILKKAALGDAMITDIKKIIWNAAPEKCKHIK